MKYIKLLSLLIIGLIFISLLSTNQTQTLAQTQSRYLSLRANLRINDPDNSLFRPEEWVYLDPGLTWENESENYVSFLTRDARLRVYPLNNTPYKKTKFIRTSEDPGFGRLSGQQIDWSQLVIAKWRISVVPYSYFVSRLTLGKSNYYPVGSFQQGPQGIGFRISQGNGEPKLVGIAHNGGEQINGHESVYLTLPEIPNVDYFRNTFTLTVISFGDGAVEFFVNDISVGYISTGGPSGYISPLIGPGYGVRIEITNTDTYEEGNPPVNYTEISFNGGSYFIYEQ